MVSDQEIARGVETLLRQLDPTAVTTLNGVVQHLEAKMGLDLSHKAPFIRDLLLRNDHFALQHFPQMQPHFPSHLAPNPQINDLNFRQPQPPPPPPPAMAAATAPEVPRERFQLFGLLLLLLECCFFFLLLCFPHFFSVQGDDVDGCFRRFLESNFFLCLSSRGTLFSEIN